ncbi:MAG TPA: 5-formyltetrahydrofolate cyclo-ligase [Thermoguttaceae bacterium]|nr:5-formyltetrahydrofolate cyclo-ligase [Thermoguttaceae bacterium]
MTERPDDARTLKRELRAHARNRRKRQPDKDGLSRRICRRLASLPEYERAAMVMFYVDFASEVRTRQFLPAAWEAGKRVVVPFCAGDELELFRIESMEELAEGSYGILEPTEAIRSRRERRVDAAQLDLIVVPGLAFDCHGGRLGQGKGYYDRLLRTVRPDATVIALAFECQLFPAVPMRPNDVYVHKVITEAAVYDNPTAK